jgi:hypothetical protein
MSDLADAGIADRMADFFERQLKWIDDGFAFVETLPREPDTETLEAFVTADARRARELRTLEHEFHALKKEWDQSGDIDPARRNRVRDLASRAEERSLALSERMEQVRGSLSQVGTELEQELSGLRVARQNVRKFRQTDSPGGGIVDRQA